MDREGKAKLLAFGRRGRPRVVSEEIVASDRRSADRRDGNRDGSHNTHEEIPSSQPDLLQGPIILTTSNKDYHLDNQTILIGRSQACDIQLVEETISKRHAALSVNDRSVTVEDLGSTNGVYVSGIRIFKPHQLRDGDRIVIGSKVLSVFSQEANKDRTTALPPAGDVASVPPSQSLIPELAAESTKREDALKTLGRLADKLLTMGRAIEAERVLSDHLMKILGGARAGLVVPERIRTPAAKYALKLADSTRRIKWIDYCLELHLRSESPLALELLVALDRAVRDPGAVDRMLLRSYMALLDRLMLSTDPDAAPERAAAQICRNHLKSLLPD